MSVNLERDLAIRWKLLCIYYDRLITNSRERPDPVYKLAQDEKIDISVVYANTIFLIEENLLRGTISHTTGGAIPFVTRINSTGMKLVERLFEESQKSLDSETQTKLAKLESKTDKVLEWIKVCIQGKNIVQEIWALIKNIPLT